MCDLSGAPLLGYSLEDDHNSDDYYPDAKWYTSSFESTESHVFDTSLRSGAKWLPWEMTGWTNIRIWIIAQNMT
jgi:hypothetical protein